MKKYYIMVLFKKMLLVCAILISALILSAAFGLVLLLSGCRDHDHRYNIFSHIKLNEDIKNVICTAGIPSRIGDDYYFYDINWMYRGKYYRIYAPGGLVKCIDIVGDDLVPPYRIGPVGWNSQLSN